MKKAKENVRASSLTAPDFSIEIVNHKYREDFDDIKPLYWSFAENLLNEENKNDLYKDTAGDEDLCQNNVINIHQGLNSYGYMSRYGLLSKILRE